jgi:hypothetical protein
VAADRIRASFPSFACFASFVFFVVGSSVARGFLVVLVDGGSVPSAA